MNVVIGLGANLGDRLATIREAIARIGRVATLRARSYVYETAPVGRTDQPPFLNAAIAAECGLSPMALLDALLAIEKELGRIRSDDALRWGPRTIDLDILWIDGVVVDDARLVIPHPRLTERAFALGPLLEVAPGAIDPRTRKPYHLSDVSGRADWSSRRLDLVPELTPLVFGDLTIEPLQASPGGPVHLFWHGKSNDRHPARTVVPYVTEVLAFASGEKAVVSLHFETIEHMNSSTITAIIQIIQEARTRATQLIIVFDPAKTWQKLSFEALRVFAKEDGMLRLIGESKS